MHTTQTSVDWYRQHRIALSYLTHLLIALDQSRQSPRFLGFLYILLDTTTQTPHIRDTMDYHNLYQDIVTIYLLEHANKAPTYMEDGFECVEMMNFSCFSQRKQMDSTATEGVLCPIEAKSFVKSLKRGHHQPQ
ncbi:hypothetical protein PROFUN_09271 [Planoprotostelium fungivorum]|uniref:Uncharacterized protein n=1 Tax=Planoprotostelium fungivorum TaxID=1890364 RepID=A0A2P6NKY4_9EUKA|nr:hypothetical protein PROFUN_09271 [Planoprotostelium fungivorum]